MKRIGLILIIVFVIASCSSETNYDNLSGTEMLTKLDQKVYSSFNKTVNEIINDYGDPKKIDTIVVTNKHTDYEDNLYTLQYDDFDIEIYHSIEIDKYLLQSVLFKSDEFLEDLNISFGMSRKDCEFLSPNKVEEIDKGNHKEVVYSIGKDSGIIAITTFYFKNNSLCQVKYNAPID